jgi:hypothetical protein
MGSPSVLEMDPEHALRMLLFSIEVCQVAGEVSFPSSQEKIENICIYTRLLTANFGLHTDILTAGEAETGVNAYI